MIKVFVIDDSSMVREYFKKLFDKEPDIKLMATASNPIEAINIIKRKGFPDIFILDIEMPQMDGLTFLKDVAVKKKIPTIMCSYLVEEGSKKALEALELGAVDIIHKSSANFVGMKKDIISKIKAIIESKPQIKNVHQEYKSCEIKKHEIKQKSIKEIVGIASSTGGIPVIDNIISHLQPHHAPIVIVQHMQDDFTAKLAHRLDEAYHFTNIKEAKDGDVLMRGRILIAKAGIHCIVYKEGTKYKIGFRRMPPVDYHKPSGTVLFASMAKCAKDHAVGVILTGMGTDGATGLKMIKEVGGVTMAQSKASSVVFGMPKQAVEIGAVNRTNSVANIIKKINSF
jgi:two-component system chemotaxis response regulator CheB